jgi:23S rRNA U2552 (ribose-2'-O)-methylase RlmE/FtsJ
MDNLLEGAPPWKSVEWVKSPSWTPSSVPPLIFVPWITNTSSDIASIKEKIGSLDKEHKWELAKKMVNPYELVYTHDDDRLPPSLSLDQPLSRSYFKLIEILEVLKFFDEYQKLRTGHIAEGPGGFIQAVHVRAAYKKKQVTSSLAMTLRPTTSHVPGWKKASAFLYKYKQVKVHYGEDGTGDIYMVKNQASFIAEAQTGLHLFTADGGFDFSTDYSCQEQNVFHLLVCSSIIGLQVLLQGGSFILKFFDCDSPHTMHLIILLGRCFKEWTLYKPAMTRPCNSERYFLGKGFRSLTPECLASLKSIEEQSRFLRYPTLETDAYLEHENAFLKKHIDASITQQIKYIESAIILSKTPNIWWSNWLPSCINQSALWCETFHVNSHPRRAHAKIMMEKYPQYSQTYCTGASLQ